MKQNPAKVKFIIILACLFLACLLALTTYQLVMIQKMHKQISQQQDQIEALENEINYYENIIESKE